MAALPQPFPGAGERLGGDLAFAAGPGTFVEGLWFNQAAPDRRFEITAGVRRAVAYALDRERIAEAALGSIVDDPAVLQCAGWNPVFGEWCGNDFARYVQDMAAVDELLTAEGWSRPDPDGLWVNADGEELILQWNTVAGNQRREEVQALVAEMTRPFGIGWEIVNYDPSELFQVRLPAMDFGPAALYASPTEPDPSVARLYDIDGIPSEANGYSGENYMAYASPAGQRAGLCHRRGDRRSGAAGAGSRARRPAGRRRSLDSPVRAAQPAGMERRPAGGAGRVGCPAYTAASTTCTTGPSPPDRNSGGGSRQIYEPARLYVRFGLLERRHRGGIGEDVQRLYASSMLLVWNERGGGLPLLGAVGFSACRGGLVYHLACILSGVIAGMSSE